MMKPTHLHITKGSTYPLEFREEAVRCWLSSGQTLKSVACGLGVSPECLRAWRKQMEATPGSTAASGGAPTAEAKTLDTPTSDIPTSPELALARELGQVRREEAMTRQRDILKGYFHLLERQKPGRRFEVMEHLTQPLTHASPTTAAFEVREVCAVLSLSSSGYYAHRHKGEQARCREDQALARQVKSAFDDSQGTYGSPRLVRALRQRGWRTSKTRVRRLMQKEGLCPRQKRRVRVRTTKSNP